MNKQLISVIIPIYNVEPYLDRCVQSVIDQTYRSLEIILVDDGSPDHCSAMCDAWAKKDPRIKVIHKVNGGLSDARNAGLAIATGELISFVDSDDWLAPAFYERLTKALDEDQSDIAACTVEMVWEDGTPSRLLTVQENRILERTDAELALLNENQLKDPVWYKLYKKHVLDEIVFEAGKQHEDVYWTYQVVGNAKRVSLIDYVGYYYWQRNTGIMGNNSYTVKRLDAIEAFEQRYAYIAKEFPELERIAKRGIVGACIYHGQMVLRYLPKQEQKSAFSYLEQVNRRYPLNKSDYQGIKATHQLWLTMAQCSLKLVCHVKNILKVGL